jgi:hypothetical protein
MIATGENRETRSNGQQSYVLAQHAHRSPHDESATMSDAPSREEIKAQIEASEARGETKSARLEGKCVQWLKTTTSNWN